MNTARQLNNLAITLIGLTILLMVGNVVMSARVAQDGLLIDSLSKKEAVLNAEIRELEQNIISKTSLNDLSLKAQELGYSNPNKALTVSATAPLAFKP